MQRTKAWGSNAPVFEAVSNMRIFWIVKRKDRRQQESALSAHLDHSHHAEIFVIQDVAMIDGSAREILEWDPNPDTFAHRHIDDISPSQEARLPTIFAHDLERVGVDMKRVIKIHHHHSAAVNDLGVPSISVPKVSVGGRCFPA
jgi:hypothetical protein